MADASPVSSRQAWLTLIAMTLASSMILVDQTAVPLASPDVVLGLHGNLADGQWILTANILPLAAFLVLGGRLGDVLGLRRVFLAGALVFAVATAFAGAAQDMVWIITARAVQGTAAAVMMPTSVAITSAVWPRERRGYALGILAGASAFFAAVGPVLGGVLTAVDWRLVFLINVPLAIASIFITVTSTPDLRPDPSSDRTIDWFGALTLAIAMVGLVFGLSEGQPEGWVSPVTVGPLGISVIAFTVFIRWQGRAPSPLLDLTLFRRMNLLASTISQLLSGMLELGLGYLLPFYLLLVVGVGPITAGIALIPGTIPIILAGPLAGRMFDRIGGRLPLTVGFLVLALSGVLLALGAGGGTAVGLLPGLVAQGVGLGVVLTVNDPVGMNAVDDADQGAAAGIINTAEQVGGAIGIAGLAAIQIGFYFHLLYQRLARQNINPTPEQSRIGHDFIAQAEVSGLHNVPTNPTIDRVINDLIDAHAQSFQLAFYVSAGIALIGAVTSFALVRKSPRVLDHPVFSRRSRWLTANAGATTSGLTRVPADAPEDADG